METKQFSLRSSHKARKDRETNRIKPTHGLNQPDDQMAIPTPGPYVTQPKRNLRDDSFNGITGLSQLGRYSSFR